MRVCSWNVNGLRAAHQKGFLRWLEQAEADVVGLQEVRAKTDQLAPELRTPRLRSIDLYAHFSEAKRPGYSGVGLYAKQVPDEIETTLGNADFDDEGRFQRAQFGRLTICNVYFPNGSGRNRDNSRIPYKLDFYRRVFDLLHADFRRDHPILVMGDFNTAHHEIDLARPKDNQKTSGFRPEERAEMDRWIDAGWVDTFRHFEPAGGYYTWWSQRVGVRERNIGWRIDYVLASPGATPFLRKAFVWPDVMGSDHCPIGVDIDDAVMG